MVAWKVVLFVSCLFAVSVASEASGSFWDKITSVFGFRSKTSKEAAALDELVFLTDDELASTLTLAMNAASAQDYNQSVEYALKFLEYKPQHVTANLLLGNNLLVLERPDLALDYLHVAARLSNWTNLAATNNLAEALRLTGDYDLAIKIIQRYIDLKNDSDASGLLDFTLGSIYADSGNQTAAQQWYLASALKQPANVEAWIRASTMLSNERQFEHAEKILSVALRENPSSGELHYYMGVVLHATDRIQQAIEFYDQALVLDKTHVRAMSNLATAYHYLGRLQDANDLYRLAISLSPSNSVLLENYARLLHTAGLLEDAQRVANEALVLRPDDVDLQQFLKEVTAAAEGQARVKAAQAIVVENARNNNMDAVINTLVEHGEPATDKAWWYFSAGMAFLLRYICHTMCFISLIYTSGQMEKAEQFCSESVKYETQSLLIHSCVAISRKRLGRREDALPHFITAYNMLVATNYQEPLPFLGFSMNVADLAFNVLQELHYAKDYNSCLVVGNELLGLPGPTEGGMMLLSLSYVDWTPEKQEMLNTYGASEAAKGRLKLGEGATLIDTLNRLRQADLSIVDIVYDCYTRSSNELHTAATADAADILQQATIRYMEKTEVPKSQSEGGVVLISQFFASPDEAIAQGVATTLQKNLDNPLVDSVVLINQQEYDFSKLSNAQKIQQFITNDKLRFSTALTAATNLFSGRYVVIAPPDVFLDETVSRFRAASMENLVFALSKWVVRENGMLTLPLTTSSQDAWAFVSPLPAEITEKADFYVGAPRSDGCMVKLLHDISYK